MGMGGGNGGGDGTDPNRAGTITTSGTVFNDGGFLSNNGVLEPDYCKDIDDEDVQRIKDATATTSGCATNTCNGGCCRLYNFLKCDTDNSSPHLHCVCNDNTYKKVTIDRAENIEEGTAGAGSGQVSAVVTIPAAQIECAPEFRGNNFGQHPDNDVELPEGLERGDCEASRHCKGTVGGCCLKHMCFCGNPVNEWSDDCLLF